MHHDFEVSARRPGSTLETLATTVGALLDVSVETKDDDQGQWWLADLEGVQIAVVVQPCETLDGIPFGEYPAAALLSAPSRDDGERVARHLFDGLADAGWSVMLTEDVEKLVDRHDTAATDAA